MVLLSSCFPLYCVFPASSSSALFPLSSWVLCCLFNSSYLIILLCHITDLSKRKLCGFFGGLGFSGLVFGDVFCVELVYYVMAWLTVRASLRWVID